MIEISHQQAQRMLRKRMDGQHLPDAQWAVLQAHLDGCPDCRAYAARRRRLERGLSLALRSRWDSRDLPSAARSALGSSVHAAQVRRASLRLTGFRAGLALLAVLVFAYYGYRRENAPPAPEPTPFIQAADVEPTPVDPRLAEDTFRGVFAYSGLADDGAADIFLVNRREPGPGGTEITNLTEHPAQDLHPLWSPDGEWIVFLSNRQPDGSVGDKSELYAVTVAGTRLTRLTNAPDIEWQGPLSWSEDGYMIALTGTRKTTGAGPFVYLVPVGVIGPDGSSAPRSLANTRGVPGPLRFSPTSSLLAYTLPGDTGGLMLYHLRDRTYYPVTYHESAELRLRVGLDGAFDWLPSGWQIGYLARGRKSEVIDMAATPGAPEPIASLRVTTSLMLDAAARKYRTENTVHYRARGEDSLRGLAISSNQGRLLMANLADTSGRGCWQVEVYDPSRLGVRRSLEGLCVQGDLLHESWSPDGRWLIVNGAPRDEPVEIGIYALRVPEDTNLREEVYYARIADAAPAVGIEGSQAWAYAQPLVKPTSRYPLEITIAPAPEDAVPVLAPQSPPASAPGTILYEVREDDNRSTVYAINPDGSDRRMLVKSGLSRACPALAPDGSRFAYLDQSFQTFGVSAVMVMSLDGNPQLQVVASALSDGEGDLQMSCPVWSPDGKYLAWLSYRPNESLLKIFAVDEGRDWIHRIPPVSSNAQPAWSPESTYVLYATALTSNLSPRVLAVPVSEDSGGTLTVFDTARQPETQSFTDIIGLIYSDNSQLAMIHTGDRYTGASMLVELLPMRWPPRYSDLPSSKFGNYFAAPVLLQYLPDDSLIFSIRHEVDALHKTTLWIYEPEHSQRRPLLGLEDMLYDAAISPDGRWMVYSSDAGLYALDLAAARRDGQATPALLSTENVYDVQWR